MTEFECPTCDAPPGRPCVRKRTKLPKAIVHRARRKLNLSTYAVELAIRLLQLNQGTTSVQGKMVEVTVEDMNNSETARMSNVSRIIVEVS